MTTESQLTTESRTEPPTSHVIKRLRERDALIGWRFESYSDITGTWTTVTTLDGQLTEAELREQHGRIRQLTPLVPLDTVRSLRTNDDHATAVSTPQLATLPCEGDHARRWTQARGRSQSTRTWMQEEANE